MKVSGERIRERLLYIEEKLESLHKYLVTIEEFIKENWRTTNPKRLELLLKIANAENCLGDAYEEFYSLKEELSLFNDYVWAQCNKCGKIFYATDCDELTELLKKHECGEEGEKKQ
jgi:methionyl-tRNA synthetase